MPSLEDAAREVLPDGWTLQDASRLQSLWAGYGSVLQLKCTDPTDKVHSLILKLVSPPAVSDDQDEGSLRKLLSYQVEQHFYSVLVPYMQAHADGIHVSTCLASRRNGSSMSLLLEDLRPRFPQSPGKRGTLDTEQSCAALRWLARFHGFWRRHHQVLAQDRHLCEAPLQEARLRARDRAREAKAGVWMNGGYTYLATRQREYAALKGSEWACLQGPVDADARKSIAEAVAEKLAMSSNPDSPCWTLLHGDVKSENLLTTEDGKEAAFFDFQYTGVGLGVCDLAKLFTCSISEEMLGWNATARRRAQSGGVEMCSGEKRLLERYLEEMRQMDPETPYDLALLSEHWELALVDWLRFQAGWGFWGATDWLEARVRHILAQPVFLRSLQ